MVFFSFTGGGELLRHPRGEADQGQSGFQQLNHPKLTQYDINFIHNSLHRNAQLAIVLLLPDWVPFDVASIHCTE